MLYIYIIYIWLYSIDLQKDCFELTAPALKTSLCHFYSVTVGVCVVLGS